MFKKMLGGRKAQRTFKVTNVVNTDGCPTKFKAGRYTGNHMSAAKKAFTTLSGTDSKGINSLFSIAYSAISLLLAE